MDFIELVEKRYSLRKYKDQKVEQDQLLAMVEAARKAPSAKNIQPWHFILVTEKEVIQNISKSYPAQWLQDAPAIIVTCGNHEESWKRADGKDSCDIDLAIAIEHMALQATSLGLGTCWVCAFDHKICHETLQLPEHLEIIALLPVGYPEEGTEAPEKKRKSIEEIVSWQRY